MWVFFLGLVVREVSFRVQGLCLVLLLLLLLLLALHPEREMGKGKVLKRMERLGMDKCVAQSEQTIVRFSSLESKHFLFLGLICPRQHLLFSVVDIDASQSVTSGPLIGFYYHFFISKIGFYYPSFSMQKYLESVQQKRLSNIICNFLKYMQIKKYIKIYIKLFKN